MIIMGQNNLEPSIVSHRHNVPKTDCFWHELAVSGFYYLENSDVKVCQSTVNMVLAIENLPVLGVRKLYRQDQSEAQSETRSEW